MIWAIACMLAMLVNFWTTHRLLDRLQRQHPGTWTLLGSPRLGESNLGPRWLEFAKYIWTLRFREAHDSELNRLGWASLTGEAAALMFFLMSLVA
ncbi:hypothetical protein [Ramlibacter albus]|nr:hypothetical protein [Ramlibacter albus]